MIDLWLKHVRQEGLVVSQSALNEENLVPVKQTADDTSVFADNASDFWQLGISVLEWPQSRILRGADLPAEATCRLTEMDVTLKADAALAGKADEPPRLLVKCIEHGSDPDSRISIGNWSGITEQQAFERHLRETGVAQGLLVTDQFLRLTYSPSGETPGFLEWPIDGLKTTAGREMLSGLKLLLGKNAIWGSAEARLDAGREQTPSQRRRAPVDEDDAPPTDTSAPGQLVALEQDVVGEGLVPAETKHQPCVDPRGGVADRDHLAREVEPLLDPGLEREPELKVRVVPRIDGE